jgi:hypothetical protein
MIFRRFIQLTRGRRMSLSAVGQRACAGLSRFKAHASALTYLIVVALIVPVHAAEVTVRTPAELTSAVAAAKPGTRIAVAPGEYGGGFHFVNVRGETGNPIIIAAADPKNPPTFSKAKTGMHFSGVAHLELQHLVFAAISTNGLNIDDGGRTPNASGTHHVVLRGLHVSDIGGGGNEDGIKLSGVVDFQVSDCTIERWGTGGGSAIDMVGCHRGVIENCVIRHTSPPNCTGLQCKGGSSEIAIRTNRFEYAGGRAVNIGGNTGLQFFRPPLVAGADYAEARNIRVEGNTFVGGMSAVAFAGADGAIVRFNTIERPERWALRIVQENRAAGFVACRNGEFSDNLVIFDSNRWSEGGVNIGSGTDPSTFKFARNWWYCGDRPARSTPRLPVSESDGIYGDDPVSAGGKAGAGAWRPK